MTTISNVHGFLHDGDSVDDWAEVEDGGTGTTVVDNGDYLKLVVTNCVGNESYLWDNDNNIGINTTTYPTIMGRYKTSDSSIKAKVVVEFSDVSTQEVLADISSTTWVTFSATLTAAKTLDHIRLHADHATGTVWYDFILVHQNTFTIPDTQVGDIEYDFPPREVIIPILGKNADSADSLGSLSTEIRGTYDIDLGTWKRTTPADTIEGEVFLDILHNRSSEPWQWYDDVNMGIAMKVTVHPKFRRTTEGIRLDLVLREYSLGDKSEETYAERWGI